MDNFLYIRNTGYRSIDQNDYQVFQRFNLTMMYEYDVMLDDTLWPCEIDVDVDEDDHNETQSRITYLKVPNLDYNARLPAELMGLSALRILKADSTGIGSIPPSIRSLRNLQKLDLSHNTLQNLPREIGDLNNLKELDLSFNPLSSLPNSIGSLQNLTMLKVHSTMISSFPDELWNLGSLKKLLACHMEHFRRHRRKLNISPLIERLQTLEILHLGSTGILDNLPHEIGNLQNLATLVLKGPQRIKLPPTLKNLYNLTELVLLSRTKIDVQDVNVVGMLPNLTHFFFLDTRALEYTDEEFLQFLQIVQQSNYLGAVDLVLEEHLPGLSYALGCNRFQKRVNGRNPFYVSQELLLQKLWPLVLTNAAYPFRPWKSRQCPITAQNAVYTLLKKGRGSFLQVLHHRNSTKQQNKNK